MMPFEYYAGDETTGVATLGVGFPSSYRMA
jgi:hypothetical protein